MGHLLVRRTPQPGRLSGMGPPQPPATSLSSELYCCIYHARSLCHRRHHDARQRRPPTRVHPPTSNSESALRHAVKNRRHQCMDEAPLHQRNHPLVPRSKARHQVERPSAPPPRHQQPRHQELFPAAAFKKEHDTRVPSTPRTGEQKLSP